MQQARRVTFHRVQDVGVEGAERADLEVGVDVGVVDEGGVGAAWVLVGEVRIAYLLVWLGVDSRRCCC